ncbi:hypothetical protein DLAC_10976 [Tieghemostelium lacteum]|uniref:Uncharacterized protein n=1 Tax=Tieghemostelium lacteum TaxID=361077 RepID=A0A151Z387_TIELA|nr:hypothetical protein DLAC_10976 [Tieghemostelium lacteum]|eukprot:KYQ88284.1 hypothetical protein DLAC_10976 [Tieghemostelium lacteum]
MPSTEKPTLTDLIQQLTHFFNSIHSNGEVENPDKQKLETYINDMLLQSSDNITMDDISFYASHFVDSEPLYMSILKNIIKPSFGFKEDIICKWFYQWYCLNVSQTKKFVLSFLPGILWMYLDKSSPSNLLTGIEALFIGIYNQEFNKREGKEKIFNPPVLPMQSFIDKPLELQQHQQSGLTENTLKLLNSQSKSITLEKSLPRIEIVTTQTKSVLIKTIINNYTSIISTLPIHSRVIYCEMASRLSSNGLNFQIKTSNNNGHSNNRNLNIDNLNESKYSEFDGDQSIPTNSINSTTSTTTTTTSNTNKFSNLHGLTSFLSHKSDLEKRIYLTDKILQELVTGLTFCAFQDSTRDVALLSVQMLHQRANYDLIPELLLSTNSLLNVLNK